MTGSRQSHLFPTTETGDAEFFAEHFGQRVKYDHRRGRWLIFRDHRWHNDSTGELHRLGIESIRLRQRQSGICETLDERRAHFKWTIGGESRQRLENMLALARNIPPISDDGEGWDADPWLLGVENGVVDIHTGTLRDGTPEDRMTMCVRAYFDPDAQCPEWEAMIARVFGGDADLMLYVQCALGYSITGITREQCLFLNTGGGSNGKGTMINTIGWLLGDYADELPFSSLEIQARGGIPNDIAKLVGKRFVTASESKKGIAWDEAKVKQLTGCDQVSARFLHHEFFTFNPVAKFWLSCNDKPMVDDTSFGFWRRMRVIPWSQQFSGSTDDKELKERLKGEADGILLWLINGCVHGWRAMGLKVPQAILDATAEYESESDILRPFLDTRCVLSDRGRVGAGQLYREYLDWATGTDTRPMSLKYFGQWAKKHFRSEVSHHATTYLGVSVRPT